MNSFNYCCSLGMRLAEFPSLAELQSVISKTSKKTFYMVNALSIGRASGMRSGLLLIRIMPKWFLCVFFKTLNTGFLESYSNNSLLQSLLPFLSV